MYEYNYDYIGINIFCMFQSILVVKVDKELNPIG